MSLLDAANTGIIVRFGSDISGLVSGTKNAISELEKLNSKTTSLTTKFTKLGVIAGAAITGIGVAIVGLSASADKTNATLGVTALTIGSTTDEMREFALGTSDAGFRLDDVISTFSLLGRAGVTNTAQMQALAKEFDTLGDSVGESAATVASTMIPAMDAYGLSIDTVSDHMDGIAYVVNHSLISFSDLSSVFASLGTTLNGIGFSMEDTEALLLAMTDAGIPAEKAVRKLRSALSDYESALKASKTAAKDLVTAEKSLADSQKSLTRLEKNYEDALKDAKDTSKEVAAIELRYNDQMADSKQDLIDLEEDYQKSLAKAQDTTKDVASLNKSRAKEVANETKAAAKLEIQYAEDKADLEKEARLNPLEWANNAKKAADLEKQYAEKRQDLADDAAESLSDYNDRLAEIQDTTEAVANVEEQYADRKKNVQEQIDKNTRSYNEDLTKTLDTSEKVADVQDSYADRLSDANDKIKEQTQAVTDLKAAAAVPVESKETVITSLGVSDEGYAAAQSKILNESAGSAETYAAANEKAISATDRLASSIEELTLQMGSAVSPFQDLGAVLAIGGPLLIALTQLPQLIGGVSTAMTFLAANPIVLIIAAVAALVLGLYYLEVKFHWIETVTAAFGTGWALLWTGMVSAVQGAANLIGGIIDTLVNGVKWGINLIIDGINTLIGGINTVSSVGGLLGNTLAIPTIPRLASGGIVTQPTIAMIGEAGPEAVVPLSSGATGAGGITITGNTFNVRNDDDIKQIAVELQTLITRENRNRGSTS